MEPFVWHPIAISYFELECHYPFIHSFIALGSLLSGEFSSFNMQIIIGIMFS